MGNFVDTREKMQKYISIFVMVLIIIQPMLDVLSYWLTKADNTSITTILRIVMLGVIVIYSFIVTDNKKLYFIFYSIIALYWLGHMVNAFRIGYMNPISDISLFIRVAQMPALTLSFITFIKKNSKTKDNIYKGSAIAFLIVIGVIILSYLTNTPDYMYYDIGVKGWFYSGNAQSIIITVLVSLTLLVANKMKNIYVFVASSFFGFGLLFISGTRVTYFSIFVIAVGLIILLIFNKDKSWIKYASLALAVFICGGFAIQSPMFAEKDRMHDNFSDSQERINESVNKEDEEKKPTEDYSYLLQYGEDKVIPNQPYTLNQYKKVYEPYMWMFKDAVKKYGFEQFLKKYDYTIDASILGDNRLFKRTIAELEWEKQDFITKLFGYENDTLIIDGNVYMMEDDLGNLLYLNGYIGMGLYLLFILYFAILAIIALFKNFKKVFTVETGLVGISIILMLGSAVFSGYVVQRPNVSIYLSLLLAVVYSITVFENNVNPYLGIKKHTKVIN